MRRCGHFETEKRERRGKGEKRLKKIGNGGDRTILMASQWRWRRHSVIPWSYEVLEIAVRQP